MRTKLIALTLPLFLSAHCLQAQGPYPADIASWTQETKDKQIEAGDKLLKDLYEAISSGQREFSVPKAHYRFNKPVGKRPFYIQLLKVKDFTFDANGSTFWFDQLATAISIYKSDNITVKNIVIDWDPLPLSQGRVTSVSPEENSFRFRIDPGYENVCTAFKDTKRQFRACLFNEAGDLKADQVGYNIAPFWHTQDEDGIYTSKVNGFYGATVSDIGMEPGDRFACFTRQGHPIKTECCGSVTIENITLYASPFIGFIENAGRGPTTYRNCRIARRPGTDRLMGGNADGFHSANMGSGPILDHCVIENIGDDFVNIHGIYRRVLKQEDPHTIIAQNFSSYENPVSIMIYDMETHDRLLRCKATVKQCQHKVEDNALTQLKKRWAAADNVEIGQRVTAKRLVLEQPIDLTGPAYLVNEGAVGQNAEIRNCRFSGSLARGIRLQSVGTIIADNDISRCAAWGITFAGQPRFWGEATHSTNITVTGNRFSETCLFKMRHPAAISIRASAGMDDIHLHDISLIENVITKPGGTGIIINGARNITVANNVIDQYGDQTSRRMAIGRQSPPLRTSEYGIEILNSREITCDDNVFRNPAQFAKEEICQQLIGE